LKKKIKNKTYADNFLACKNVLRALIREVQLLPYIDPESSKKKIKWKISLLSVVIYLFIYLFIYLLKSKKYFNILLNLINEKYLIKNKLLLNLIICFFASSYD
jgi:hypothetical protein